VKIKYYNSYPFLTNLSFLENHVDPVPESIMSVMAEIGRLAQYAVTAKIGRVNQKPPHRPKTAVSAESGRIQ
jgi:hypothetical protein